MAKKGKKGKGKKKGGKKGGKKTAKKGRSYTPKKSAAAMIGTGLSAYKTEMASDAWGSTVLNAQKNAAVAILHGDFSNPWIKHSVQVTWEQALNNAGPLALGAAVSFGKDLPVVGGPYNEFIYKPANKLFGRLQKMLGNKKRAKWRL